MLLPKPCQRRWPAPKAEGLQEGEVPREGGDSRGKRVGEEIRGGGGEGIAGEREQANLYQMVGGQRPPLPQGSVSVSERERERDRERQRETERDREREREREGERQREKERRGRESDRESESQEEGGKKEGSLYLMVGGQRAWTTLRGIIEIQKSA